MEYTPAIQAVLDRQITNASAVKGTLVRVTPRRGATCLVLVFEDGSWAWYQPEDDYGESRIWLQTDPADIEDLLQAELITAKQYDEWRIAHEQQRTEATRQNELDTLARLKAKYEGLDDARGRGETRGDKTGV